MTLSVTDGAVPVVLSLVHARAGAAGEQIAMPTTAGIDATPTMGVEGLVNDFLHGLLQRQVMPKARGIEVFGRFSWT